MWSRGIILFFITLIFTGCGNRYVIRKNKLETDYTEIIKYINNNNNKFDTYSIKYTGHYQSTEKNMRFRGVLRIIKEQRIWISIAPIGIEAARILFTPDSVKYINRQKNQFFKGDYQYFQKKYKIDLDYEILEKTLTNGFLILPESEKNVSKNKQGMFEIQMYDDTMKNKTFLLHPGLKKLTKVIFRDVQNDARLEIGFSDFIDIESHALPKTINVKVKKGFKNINVNLNYKKITVDKNFKTPFRIPGKYKEIWP